MDLHFPLKKKTKTTMDKAKDTTDTSKCNSTSVQVTL